MPAWTFVDIFPAFVDFWQQVQHLSLDEQIERWSTGFMSHSPELFEKQIADYAEQNVDWRTIAAEKIFPFLSERKPAMHEAHRNLLAVCPTIYQQAESKLGFTSSVTFVIHVGLGCGAGWVTSYQNSPAIWFGLENVAECGWSDRESIAGLIAHEFGHVIHEQWRTQSGESLEDGAWWQLYAEGFAQRCEEIINEGGAPHEAVNDEDQEWLTWCQTHRAELATEFLRAVDAGEAVQKFFGSWYDIEGHSQCGYFLGYEIIRQLETRFSLKEIAELNDIEEHFKFELRKFQ